MKLNLGCGPVQPAGWVNVDGSNRAWLASTVPALDTLAVRLGLFAATEFNARTVHVNLLKRFPWPDESIAAIYMGEILEHFTLSEGQSMLRECWRVLQPGGHVRIRVPDHANFWRQYVEQYAAMRQRPRDEWTTEHTKWTKMSFDTICVTRPAPWQSMGHFHKWMYDDITLMLACESAGFVHAARRAFHDSEIADIADVEVRDDLIVEARR